MNKNVTVVINRGSKQTDKFKGEIIGETTTHYRVAHDTNPLGELFPKQSKRVRCFLKGEDDAHQTEWLLHLIKEAIQMEAMFRRMAIIQKMAGFIA